MKKILVIPGDGIGKEIMSYTIKFLSRLSNKLEFITCEAGYEYWLRTGQSWQSDLWETANNVDGILYGCSGTPSPAPQGYQSSILALRRNLKASINIRYCRSYKNRNIDIIMLRNCNEGLDIRSERKIENGFIAEHIATENGTKILAEAAGKIAKKNNLVVTIVHKANVLQTEAYFRNIAIKSLEDMNVKWQEVHSDAAGYHLVLNPEKYKLMIMTSHVGDILSDVGAAISGGLGLVPSISIGGNTPIAEPIHGSAPDIVGTGKANPIATILAAALLLNEIGEEEVASNLESIVSESMSKFDINLTTEQIVNNLISVLEKRDNL